jgi:hypothetical protein
MSATDYLLFQKLKKKCSSQEKTLERLFESLHLAIQKSKVIPKCADWNYVKVFSFSISIKNLNKMILKTRMKMWFVFS